MTIYTCVHCDTTFNKSSNAKRHESICTGIKKGDYACDQCNKKFTRRDNLLKHVKQYHCGINVVKNSNNITNSHNVTNNNVTNITMLLTRDHQEFLNQLINLKGNEHNALNSLKNAIHEKIKGEVKLFGEIYMQGDDPNQWSVVCVDAKTKIRQEDGSWLDDPNAVESRKRFYSNYTDSMLVLMKNLMFNCIVDQRVNSDDYDYRVRECMDLVGLQETQTRLFDVCSSEFSQNTFAKELTNLYFSRLREIKNKCKDGDHVINCYLSRMCDTSEII